MDPENLEDRIRDRAYQIWREEGRPEGRAEAHWELARQMVAIEDSQKSASRLDETTTAALDEPGKESTMPRNRG